MRGRSAEIGSGTRAGGAASSACTRKNSPSKRVLPRSSSSRTTPTYSRKWGIGGWNSSPSMPSTMNGWLEPRPMRSRSRANGASASTCATKVAGCRG